MKKYKKKQQEYDILPLDKDAAAEMFSQASFIYGTQSVKETVNVLKKLGLEVIVKKALN